MKTSDAIDLLAGALSKAQGAITGALKDQKNPFYNKSYADLAACWDACRAPLASNGLAVLQGAAADDTGVIVTTRLVHESGQWVEDSLRMVPVKADPQGIGSCITYARRYALAAMVGLAQVDDDANAASGKDKDGAKQDGIKPGLKISPLGDAPVLSPKDEATVMSFVSSFTDALNADVEEDQMTDSICRLLTEVKERQDIYIEVWRRLDSKQRKAIKIFGERGNSARGVA